MSDQRLHAIVFNAITRADYARLMKFSYRKRIADAVTEALEADGWMRLADADLEAAAAWLASTEGAFASREGKVDGVLAAAFGRVVLGE